MKKKIVVELFGILILFGIIWAVFAYFPIFQDKNPLELSLEKEEQLSEKLIEFILEENKELHTPEVDSALFIIEKRLMDELELTDYEYKIRVLDVPTINAFATLGGNIFIFSGLIAFSESPEELAAILAHEIGHVENRDVVHKLVKDLGITILLSVLGGNDMILLGEISRTAASTVFDRKQEREADEFAMNLLVKAEINPRVIASFFRRLKNKSGINDEPPEFIMTHPNTNSRIKAAFSYKLPDDFNDAPFDIDWKKVKASIGTDSKD